MSTPAHPWDAMSEARCALILDDPAERHLGDIALRLLRLGIDAHYAADRGEAWLLAQQEAERIRTFLFPPSIPIGEVQAVEKRLRDSAPDALRSLVVIGPQPPDAQREALRTAGVELALWEPFDESALRTVVSMAMAPPVTPESQTREHPRLPTTLLARAFVGTRRRDAIVATLSLGGAFLETPSVLPEDTRITLEIGLPGGTWMGKARVVYVNYGGAEAAPGEATGMGLEFESLSPVAEDQLKSFLKDQEDRFSV